jgi:BolA protein
VSPGNRETGPLGPVGRRIAQLLEVALSPSQLEVSDESHRHAGHAGAGDGAGETHFRVRVVARAFAGKSRLERHRMINRALEHELRDKVHALAIEAIAEES